jgi:hypothetical protein
MEGMMRDLRNVSIPRCGLNAGSRSLRRSHNDPKRDRPLKRLNAKFEEEARDESLRRRLHPTKGYRYGRAA